MPQDTFWYIQYYCAKAIGGVPGGWQFPPCVCFHLQGTYSISLQWDGSWRQSCYPTRLAGSARQVVEFLACYLFVNWFSSFHTAIRIHRYTLWLETLETGGKENGKNNFSSFSSNSSQIWSLKSEFYNPCPMSDGYWGLWDLVIVTCSWIKWLLWSWCHPW